MALSVLERDLSTVGRLIMESRSNMDEAYAEMVLFLCNKELIPDDLARQEG